jgi:hypothetical protein
MERNPDMSRYIEGPAYGKVDILCEQYGAEVIAPSEVNPYIDMGIGVVCVVGNPNFEAAAYADSRSEADRFRYHGDHRPRVWLKMDKSVVEKLVSNGMRVSVGH